MRWFRKLLHEHHVSQAAAAAAATTATAPSLLVAASSDKQRTIVLPPPPGGKKHGCSASIASNSNSGSSSSVTLADGPSPNKKRRCTGGNVEPAAAAAVAVPIAALAEASRRASRLIAKLQPDADDETTTTMPVTAVIWRATIMEPDEFFDDPAEVAAHRAEKRLLADWQIIDALAEADNDFGDMDDDDDESDGKFQTTCFTGGDNDDDDNGIGDSDFVSVQRAPSVISLGSYTDDPYGLFASPYGWVLPKYPEAMYATFECDIQCGVPMLDVTLVSAFEEIMVETFRLDGVGGTSETLIVPPPLPETSASIARRFRLDDAGSLCLNIEHIGEERGFGFLMRRSRSVYRNVTVGQMVDERMRWSGGVPDGELDAVRLDGRRRMTQLLRRLWRCLFGGAAAARQRVHAKRGKRSARRHVREHLNPA